MCAIQEQHKHAESRVLLSNYRSRIVDVSLNEKQHIAAMPGRYTHDWIHEQSDWVEKVMDKRKQFLEEEQA
jgi:hypothetical protein